MRGLQILSFAFPQICNCLLKQSSFNKKKTKLLVLLACLLRCFQFSSLSCFRPLGMFRCGVVYPIPYNTTWPCAILHFTVYTNTAATYVPERQYVQRVDLRQLCGCMVGSEPVDPRGHDAGVVIREMLARSLLNGCGPASGAPVPRARTRDETRLSHPPPDTVAGEETGKKSR